MPCSDFLEGFIQDLLSLEAFPPLFPSCRFQAIASRTDDRFCWYMQGWLRTDTDGTALFGEAAQFFSDRRVGNQPFNVNATDTTRIQILPNGPLTLTLLSWGNVQMVYDIECRNGLLLATTSLDTNDFEIIVMSIEPPVPLVEGP